MVAPQKIVKANFLITKSCLVFVEAVQIGSDLRENNRSSSYPRQILARLILTFKTF
jgi:hypothetical protein